MLLKMIFGNIFENYNYNGTVKNEDFRKFLATLLLDLSQITTQSFGSDDTPIQSKFHENPIGSF